MTYNIKLSILLITILLIQGCLNDCSESAIKQVKTEDGEEIEQEKKKEAPGGCARFFEANGIEETCCQPNSFGKIVSQIGKSKVSENLKRRKQVKEAGDIFTKFEDLATKIAADDADVKNKLESNSDFSSSDYTALKAEVATLKGYVDAGKCDYSDAETKEDSDSFNKCKKTLREYWIGVNCLRCSAKASDFINSDGEYLFKSDVCERLIDDCAEMSFYNLCVGAVVRTTKRIIKLYEQDGDVRSDDLPPTTSQLEDFEDCVDDLSACKSDKAQLGRVCRFFNTIKPKKDLTGPPEDLDDVKKKAKGFSPGNSRRVLETSEGDPVIDDKDGASSVFGDANEDGSASGRVLLVSMTVILSFISLI